MQSSNFNYYSKFSIFFTSSKEIPAISEIRLISSFFSYMAFTVACVLSSKPSLQNCSFSQACRASLSYVTTLAIKTNKDLDSFLEQYDIEVAEIKTEYQFKYGGQQEEHNPSRTDRKRQQTQVKEHSPISLSSKTTMNLILISSNASKSPFRPILHIHIFETLS